MQHPHAVTREEEPEAGFTLIELMMVVLIIAILIAVLIPTFVGAKQRAQDRAMQSSMRNALTAAKVVYSDHGDYTLATVAGTRRRPSRRSRSSTRRRRRPGQNAVSVDPASATLHRDRRTVEVGYVLLPVRRRERGGRRRAVREGLGRRRAARARAPRRRRPGLEQLGTLVTRPCDASLARACVRASSGRRCVHAAYAAPS